MGKECVQSTHHSNSHVFIKLSAAYFLCLLSLPFYSELGITLLPLLGFTGNSSHFWVVLLAINSTLPNDIHCFKEVFLSTSLQYYPSVKSKDIMKWMDLESIILRWPSPQRTCKLVSGYYPLNARCLCYPPQTKEAGQEGGHKQRCMSLTWRGEWNGHRRQRELGGRGDPEEGW